MYTHVYECVYIYIYIYINKSREAFPRGDPRNLEEGDRVRGLLQGPRNNTIILIS